MATKSEFQSYNPATAEHLQTFAELSDTEVEAALRKANDTYKNVWRPLPVAERGRLMARVAALMRERTDELAQCAARELGKLIFELKLEIGWCIDMFEYFAAEAEKLLQPEVVASNPGCEIWSEPVGVILAIEPWNFPYLQLARVAAPQLMAGNVLLAKPAPSVPECSLKFAQLFVDSGVPEGVYTNIFANIAQLGGLLDDFRVRGVTFTGSTRAGAAVAERAGRNVKKAVLELGGSDALIILPDAPLDQAVATAVNSRMFNTGQGCAAVKRLIVIGTERGRHATEAVVSAFASLKPGDPSDPSTTLGPISSERALQGLLAQVVSARAAGAKVAYGGGQIDRPGWYMEPTVLTDIAPNNPIFQEETFGPILSVYVVESEIDAIELANATSFGLGACIMTSDIPHAKVLAEKMDVGMVFINGSAYSGPDIPFGGVKNSGFGRELSYIGFNEFVNKKLVRVALE
ncbi:unnamed protein product [Clonostachys rosea f. rosea IK726]|uniref:Aldehyde dehydrogenase domain-containing protein n=2 Tax=Bionectria ochroleuca TaxID=29856 RepID=A0A0B7K5Q8_BIOOC|nr:unnamed protein product [Clonostachys rosea f. rosea IK726]